MREAQQHKFSQRNGVLHLNGGTVTHSGWVEIHGIHDLINGVLSFWHFINESPRQKPPPQRIIEQ